MKALTEQIIKNGISDCATLLGEKNNPFPYMKQADLFVQTSLFESYGLSMTEAMILGLPVVSTKTDGATALSNNGENAQLCNFTPSDVANAIEHLLLSKEKLQSLRNAVSLIDFEQKNKEIIKRLSQIL